MKNKISKYGLLAILWLVYTLPVLAGPPDSPDSGENEQEMQDGTPIDNWELVLLVVAITIGFYFLMKHKKKITV